MIIKSQFRDYYDHVAHVYGGGDPSVVYDRNRLRPLDDSGFAHAFPVNMDRVSSERYYGNTGHYHSKWLVIAGKYYHFKKQVGDPSAEFVLQYDMAVKEKTAKQIAYDKLLMRNGYWRRKEENRIDEAKETLKLSRKIGAPVFMIDRAEVSRTGKGYDYWIESAVPTLKNLGIASIISPEQIYQDIAYYIGNVMKDSPDMAPPTVLTDKEKIVQHGFDLKKSFRHRIGE